MIYIPRSDLLRVKIKEAATIKKSLFFWTYFWLYNGVYDLKCKFLNMENVLCQKEKKHGKGVGKNNYMDMIT